MIDSRRDYPDAQSLDLHADTIVPAARSEGLNITGIGDELVVFEYESFHYHSLNPPAAAVFQLCDGHRTIANIVDAAQCTPYPLDHDAVVVAVTALGEAGLLAQPAAAFEAHVHRRQALKLTGAVALAAFALPAVASVTAPDAAAGGSVCRSDSECTLHDKACCENGVCAYAENLTCSTSRPCPCGWGCHITSGFRGTCA